MTPTDITDTAVAPGPVCRSCCAVCQSVMIFSIGTPSLSSICRNLLETDDLEDLVMRDTSAFLNPSFMR